MKGISFIEPMFNMVISKKKDMTRRVSYLPFFLDCGNHDDENFSKRSYYGKPMEYLLLDNNNIMCKHCSQIGAFPVKPRYKKGEVVYIREPYMVTSCQQKGKYYFIHVKYKYKKDEKILRVEESYKGVLNKWKSPRFMPQWAARYFVKITDVRADKLHNMTDEDCLREGVEYIVPRLKAKSRKNKTPIMPLGYDRDRFYRDYTYLKSKKQILPPEYKFKSPKDSFITLWNLINGEKYPYHLGANIFIYTFKLKK